MPPWHVQQVLPGSMVTSRSTKQLKLFNVAHRVVLLVDVFSLPDSCGYVLSSLIMFFNLTLEDNLLIMMLTMTTSM
eukprot:851743-Amphidinium_carterae.1